MPVNTARRVELRAQAVRRELRQLEYPVGLELTDMLLAKLVAKACSPAAVDDAHAAGLVADALQLRPRPRWVEAIAGQHPDTGPGA